MDEALKGSLSRKRSGWLPQLKAKGTRKSRKISRRKKPTIKTKIWGEEGNKRWQEEEEEEVVLSGDRANKQAHLAFLLLFVIHLWKVGRKEGEK